MPLTVNGHTVQAVVCTMCWQSELGEKFVERAGIQKRRRVGGGYSTNYDGTKTEYYTEPVAVSIGKIPFQKRRQFYVDAGSSEESVIGLDLLEYFDLEFDNGQKSVSLHGWNECGRPAAAWARSAAELPFKIRDGLMYATVEMNGKPVETKVSTGSPYTIMSLSTARTEFGLTPQSPGMRRTGVLQFQGGDKLFELYEYRLPLLSISGLEFRDVPLKLVDIHDYGIDLGMHELKQLHLYIAFGSGKIYAAPLAAR